MTRKNRRKAEKNPKIYYTSKLVEVNNELQDQN